MFNPKDFDLFKGPFRTYEEYCDYCRCVRKIKVGDLVEVFVNHATAKPTSVKSGVTIIRPVIGLRPNTQILLGNSIENNSFWPLRFHSDLIKLLPEKVQDIDSYGYGWWLRTITDGRIAKINLGANVKHSICKDINL